MTALKRLLVSLLVSTLVWAVFTWPLPQYLDEAIPYSSQAYDHPGISSMIAGDHLQYLYYLVLVKDMLFGETPLFYNLYEFNTGHDADRYEPDPYYLPFVLMFSLFSASGSDVIGWNLLGLATTWLSMWATWLVVRRYCDREWVAATAAAVSLAIPFRWASILGGSPMGPALLWTPLLMLGLDIAVRENRIRGGVLAGVCLLFALWTDMHAFFFLTMFTPAWCIVAIARRNDFAWDRREAYLRVAMALIPVPLFLGAAIGIRQLHTTHLVAESTRTWDEAALYSPRAAGVFGLEHGITGHIYFGYGLVAMMVFGLIALLAVLRPATRRDAWREGLVYALLFAGTVMIVLLSLGTSGPAGGKLFDLARAYVPFYSNIRQSAKIYCLVPPLVAVLMAVAHTLASRSLAKPLASTLWVGLGLWIVVSGGQHVACGLTRVELEQGAYAAVAGDAEQRGERSGAVIVPLWPGDSHFASVYQMYSVHHRIRMANGYKPMPDSKYRREFFEPFRSVNEGVLSEAQVDALLDRGINYLILHQNMYPEKVSAFPVGSALTRLLDNPRLELLVQDERVWSFRLRRDPVARPPVKPDWSMAFPARRLEAEACTNNTALVVAEPEAGRGAFARLPAGTELITEPVLAAPGPDLAWLVRVRGEGRLAVVSVLDTDASEQVLDVSSAAWMWQRVPFPRSSNQIESAVALRVPSGQVDVDMLVLVRGAFPAWAPGVAVDLEAARFFHAGFMDLDRGTVTLERGVDPEGITFYGPKWPFDPGVYEVEISFTTPAAEGTVLGAFNLEEDDATGRGVPVDLVAGRQAVGRFRRTDNLPVNCVFVYNGVADITLERIAFRRIE